jgi:hypothetical protein
MTNATTPLKISNLTDFKTQYKKAFLDDGSKKNTQEQIHDAASQRLPFVIGARVSGSTVDLGITGLKDADASDQVTHLAIDLKQVSDKYEAVAVLNDIIATVATQARLLGQKVLPVNFAVAGFETSAHPELDFNKPDPLPNDFGLHLVANADFKGKAYKSNHRMGNHLISFFNELKASLANDVVIGYQDEKIPHRRMKNVHANSDFMVDFKVVNDTIAIANSVIADLGQDENVLSMVCGSGMNIGLSEGFNASEKSFAKLTNTEAGHYDISGDSELVTTLDKETFDAGFIEKLVPDKLFSGGGTDRTVNNSAQARIDYLRSVDTDKKRELLTEILNEYPDARIDMDRVLRSNLLRHDNPSPGSLQIENYTKEGDDLAKLLLLDLSTRLGRFINKTFPEIVTNENTKKFVMTGSHIEGILDIPANKEAFNKELNKGRSGANLELVYLPKDNMDGLKDWIMTKAASLRAAA